MQVRIIETEAMEKFDVLFPNGQVIEASLEEMLQMMSRNFRGKKPMTERSWKSVCADMSGYPGKTFAYMTDSGEMVFSDLKAFIQTQARPPKLLSTREYATIYGVSPEQIKVLCRADRIMGARKVGGRWAIPSNAPYPAIHPRKARL